MKTEPCNTDCHLDSFDFISNELQEEFTNIFNSLEDAVINWE